MEVRCMCDECARKATMLQGLQLTASLGIAMPLVDELKDDLEKHRKRVAIGRAQTSGDANSIMRVSSRSWLSYDPDAFLPNPFDVFLLSGACPQIKWDRSVSGKCSRSLDVCYVVGCGRSGSTVFGDILSHYKSVLFLNEPRQLWIPLLPAMDVWSVEAAGRQGRLHFTADDATTDVMVVDESSEVASLANTVCGAYKELAALAPLECVGTDSPRVTLVEKFPEHAFRMEFLSRICRQGLGQGTCKFVHLVRDGVAVARSVACFGNSASWYGVRDEFKWKQLLTCMSSLPLELHDNFKTYLEASKLEARLFARGLVEWALSVEAARSASVVLGSENAVLEVRYESLVTLPSDTLSSLEDFMGLEYSDEVRRFAVDTLHMKETKPLSKTEMEILKAVKGSKIEKLLKDYGWELWNE